MLEGIDVKLNCDFIKNKDKLISNCKNIIYTGPIDEYFDYKYGPLEYRSVRFEEETLNEVNYQGNAVVNYTDFDVPYTRIIEHKHFEFDSTSPKTVISKEYSKKWELGEDPYYPINDDKNNALYQKYLNEALKLRNVHFGGRLGAYKYYDMDKVILEALNYISLVGDKDE